MTVNERLLQMLLRVVGAAMLAVNLAQAMPLWWICAEGPFVLGHALYMRAIHGGKTKNDKIDSEKIARLLRGGTFPMS